MVTEVKERRPPAPAVVDVSPVRPSRAPAPSGRRQMPWLVGGLTLAFAVPYLFADVVGTPRDGCYAIYVVSVLTFLGFWVARTGQDLRRIVRRNWRWALGLGLLFAGIMSAGVLRDASTVHPEGWTFAGAVMWRGVIYGAVDGLLLSSFPILATFAAFGDKPLGSRRKRAVAAIGALALSVSIAFTAVYHLGYPEFRSGDLKKPVAGDVMWSAPTLLTLNPAGAPIAHIGLHVAAVTHSYETPTFLPPHR
jgi:hypothetical protein